MRRFLLILLAASLIQARADILTLRDGRSVSGSWLGSDAGQIKFLLNDQVQSYLRSDVVEITFTGSNNQNENQFPGIKPGQTADQVEAVLGKPDLLFDQGIKKIYVYNVPPVKITFEEGRVMMIASTAKIPGTVGPGGGEAGSPVIAAILNRISVSVLDNQGSFIPNIPQANFRVFEDGVLRPIVDFHCCEAPDRYRISYRAGGEEHSANPNVEVQIVNAATGGRLRIMNQAGSEIGYRIVVNPVR